jgi:RsmE family RNA methyltransferase
LNLLLFTDRDRVAPDRIALQGRRLQHLLQVHRAAVGDKLRVGEIDGLAGIGEIVEIDAEHAVLAVCVDQPPPAKLPLRLVLALPRPKVLRRMLRSVAELGVAEVHLINSYRVEKSYWQSPMLEASAIRDNLLLGLEQARDTRLPLVHCHRRFKPFVEDTLPGLLRGHCGLLAQPGEYPPCPRNAAGHTLLVIGPEGGFIPYEVDQLHAAGCAIVSLGARILRVENALSSAVGRLY